MAHVKGRSTLPKTKIPTDVQVQQARIALAVIIVAAVVALFMVGTMLVAWARAGVL